MQCCVGAGVSSFQACSRIIHPAGEKRVNCCRRVVHCGTVRRRTRQNWNSTQKTGDVSCLRRAVLAGLCVAPVVVPANVVLSEQVRLEDVDNQKLQDAIRAAVTGEFEHAESLFSELLQEDDKSASVWSNLGTVRVSLGKYKEALSAFSRAIKLAPGAPVPLLNRAIAFEALGNYEDAISDCKAAIEIDPEEYAAWYNLGNVDVQVKDYDSALNAYEKAAALAPGIAGYRLRQALVLFQLDKLEEAKKLIQGLVRKYPNYTEAHAALAAILWNEGQRSEAEDQFNQATIQDSKYNNIRWVKASLQWPPDVVQAMEEFLAISIK